MNRAGKAAKQRGPKMSFTQVEPQSNPSRTQAEPESNFDRTEIELALAHSNKTEGLYTAVAIANACQVTDTAVRKALKAFKQVLPEELLMADNKRFTELAQELMFQYFRRPDGMTGAEWIYELRQVVGAMPETTVSEPVPQAGEFWAKEKGDKQMECTALATRSQVLLAQVQALNDSDELGEDEDFEAEKERRRELAYQRELALRLAEAQGKAQARMDVKRGA